MDINIRIQQIKEELHSCNKEMYRRDEIIPELLALQDEIVHLTFNEIHSEQAQLRIWDVENHLEELNREKGNVAAEELEAFKADCKDFVNYIKGIKSGYRGEEWTFRKLEGLRTENCVLKNIELKNDRYHSELDAVVLTHKGAFIIEIKNTQRDVFIDENGHYYRTGEFLNWASDIGFKMRIKIQLLEELLEEEGFNVPITPIILFSNNRIHVQNKCPQLTTCFLRQVNYLIEDFESEDVLSDRDMDAIAERISRIEGTDEFPIKTDTAKLKRDFAALMARLEIASGSAIEETVQAEEIERMATPDHEEVNSRHPFLGWIRRTARKPWVRRAGEVAAAVGMAVVLIRTAVRHNL